MTAAITWACPKCGIGPASCRGKKRNGCQNGRVDGCLGFICECEGTAKGLQAWERKALDAGWTPPADRQREMESSQ